MENQIVRHECEISRRGKGAKGTVKVATFAKSKTIVDGVTKEWDYGPFKSQKLRDLIDMVETHARGINLNEAFMRGIDLMIKSESLQSQSKSNELAEMIYFADLAEDMESAETIAKAWVNAQNAMRKIGMAIPSIEDLSAQRQKVVDKLKAEGNWNPKLVKPTTDVANDDDAETDL